MLALVPFSSKFKVKGKNEKMSSILYFWLSYCVTHFIPIHDSPYQSRANHACPTWSSGGILRFWYPTHTGAKRFQTMHEMLHSVLMARRILWPAKGCLGSLYCLLILCDLLVVVFGFVGCK